ncbi:MAG: hypothetical protein HW421_1213 [Ignavibacteria bacterium]|nr:hypothetical protein [Ignavibacteria bacterium]
MKKLKPLREFALEEKFFVVGHRGSSGTAPENTLPSYIKAIESGCEMLEIDIQTTADNRIITFHDPTLERTTNGKGKVKDFDYKQLQSYDAGSWFSSEFSGTKIPLMDDVLKLVAGKVYLNIEIKSSGKFNTLEEAEYLLGKIMDAELEDYTLLASFNYDILKKIKISNNNIHTAAIKLPADKRLSSEIASEIGCEAFVCSLNEINQTISDDAEKSGLYIGVYSIDTEEHLKKFLRYNIKALVTNFPEKIIKLLKSNSINQKNFIPGSAGIS